MTWPSNAALLDDFNRADGSLNGMTTSVGGYTWAAPLHTGNGAARVGSNHLVGNNETKQYDSACVNHDFGTDIRVSAKLISFTSNYAVFTILLRVPYSSFPYTYGSGSTFYQLDCTHTDVGNDTIQVSRDINSVTTVLINQTSIGTDWVVGDEVAIEVKEGGSGTDITVYRNGSVVASTTDTNGSRPLTGQKVAIGGTGVNSTSPTTMVWDDLGVELATLPLDTVLPDADITTTGWSTAPLFSKINDDSDATVIQATAS